MNYAQSILQIHPDLEFGKDFIVEDSGNGPELTWLNETIPQPNQTELEAAWLEVEAQQAIEAEKLAKKQQIEQIASLTDQLNLLGGVLYKLTKDSTDPEIIEARKTYENIQLILNG